METGKLKKTVLETLVVLVLCGAARSKLTPPVPLTEVNTEYTERTPFLSFDELTLYFCRQDTGSFYYTRIYTASRSEPFGLFTAVEEVSELNYSGGHVSSPWVSPDNLRMYYNRTESGDYWRFKFSERASVDDPWSVGSNISELNALAQHAARPRLSEDELIIVFHSAEISGGEGGYDIWMATRADRYSVFGNVTNLAEVNTSANDKEAFISDDGLTLYFASDRNGVDQIFKARRSSRAEDFGTLEHLAVFDTALGSTCPAISADGTEFFFAARDPVNEKLDIHVSYSVEPNLVAHWTFDEGTGSIAHDSAGTNHGAITGAEWTTGQIGSALDFNGTGDYISISPDANLSVEYITMSAWVKAHDPDPPGNNHILHRKMTKDATYVLYLKDNRWKACIRLQGPSMFKAVVSDAPPTTEWTHLCATYDGNGLRLYVNGELQSDIYTISGQIDTDNPGPLAIGTHPDGQSFFGGIIDDVRIYDRALTAEEIWALANPQIEVAIDIKPGSCPNPLNLKSRGVVPAAVLGTEDLDVNTIDIVSLRLEGVTPVRSHFEDVGAPVTDGNECDCTAEGPDGYTDLNLKFETQQIVEALLSEYDELAKNEMVVLTLTGTLHDGTPIEGTDCVIIKGSFRSELRAAKADINDDGFVDILDFAAMAQSWLQDADID